jgi:hypothetical protein
VVSERFTEKITNDTLRYLQGLFDVEKFKVEHNEASKLEIIPREEELGRIKRVIDDVIGQSGYNKVDLGALFSFMDK